MKPYPRKNDSVSVLGLGRSGMATVEYFVEKGMRVYAYDDAPPKALREIGERLSLLGVPLFAGGEGEIRGDFVFRSPVIRPDTPRLCRAALRGSVIWGEAEYFAARCPSLVYAVSGSDGKTTTASLLCALLTQTGKRVYLGGNIGRSLLPFLDRMGEEDLCVLELSSFQLMDFDAPLYTGILTNLSPNHLNWHKDMAEYTAAKRRLLSLSSRRVIRKGLFDEEGGTRFSAYEQADFCLRGNLLYGRGIPLCRLDDMRLAGLHNVENLLAAAAAAENTVRPHDVLSAARHFSGVAHRMEWVAKINGVDYYNSSIDTTPTRTAVTLEAFRGRGGRRLLLLGGRDKGVPFDILADAVLRDGALPYLFGEAGELIGRALRTRGIAYTVAETMADALFVASRHAACGDIVLLSPACTAFDAYRDFEERGEVFRRLVKDINKTSI